MDVPVRATYRIETFGGLAITGGTSPLAGAATQRKPMLLLAVLAASGAQGVSREKLLGLFWPDSDTERARNALKQAIHSLRRDLRDPEAIVGTAAVRLNPDVIASDVGEFDEAIARGEPERAAALYRGPFLDGLYLDGAPDFERWLERERGRLAHVHAAAVEKLAVGAGAAGDHARAVAWWRRLAAGDPLSSRVALELMKAHVAAGEPEAALQHARVHEALVRQELEAAPDPAVTALADRVREGLRTRAAAGAPPVERSGTSAETGGEANSMTAAGNMATGSVPDPSPIRPHQSFRPDVVVPHRRVGVALALLLAVALAGIAVATRGQRRGPAPVTSTTPAALARSIAVLPFVDLSADSGTPYFGDGLSDELITVLGRIDGLRVAARTSSFALRDARLDVRTIGDTLGVTSVLEGSVRREGSRLRVTAQLVDAATGYQRWSGQYDRELDDVLAVQDEIAAAIAGALRLTLVGPARPAGRGARSGEAYDLYLRGNYFHNRLARADLFKALEHYDHAIAIDPGFAPAWAGRASALLPLVYFRHVPRDSGIAEVLASARRALALDERLGSAHSALGGVHMFFEWDWPAAERELRRATEVDPDDAFAYNLLANFLSAMGRTEEAIAQRRRAIELDPLNVRITIAAGGDMLAVGRLDEALEYFRRATDVDSMNPLLIATGPRLPRAIGEVLERQGKPAEAMEEYVRIAARRGATPAQRDAMRRAFAAGGMPAFWREWLRFDQADAKVNASRALRTAALYARIGDMAAAGRWLERAYAERDPGLVYLAIEEPWRSLRDDPHVASILERMRLPH